MVNQGFEPGDPLILRVGLQQPGQRARLGSDRQLDPAMSDLYNGAIIIDFRDTGGYRAGRYEPTPYQEMFVGTYNNNSIGANHQWQDQGGDSAYGMATAFDLHDRLVMARAIYDERRSRRPKSKRLDEPRSVDLCRQ